MIIGDTLYFTRYSFVFDKPDLDRCLNISGGKLTDGDYTRLSVSDEQLAVLLLQLKS
jgi:hypothetical protein